MDKTFIDQLPDIRDVRFSFGRKRVDQRAKNYVIYCRKSEEDDDKKSIPAQLEQCNELASREGLHVIGIVREQKSARTYGRKKFTNLLNAIQGKEELAYLEMTSLKKPPRPDGIIAWHPDRLARNMRDAGEIIEMLDDGSLLDLRFVMYSFHNDSSGKEHLAMEFARAKGYSDHLQDNVFRGTMKSEMEGKRTKNLPPAFTVIDDKDDPHYLKIIASEWHDHWRSAFRWKLEGKKNEDIADLMMQAGYAPKHKYNKKMRATKVDKDHVGSHLKNPLHCGWYLPKKSKEPRKADLNDLYPETYHGEQFPIVVTVEDFKKINPQMFSDTAKKPVQSGRYSRYALSGKVLCKKLHDKDKLATLAGGKPRSATGKLSPRFMCQRCKPSHSVDMETLFTAVGEKLKGIKVTEREHKLFVVTEWHRYEEERDEEEATRRNIAAMKGQNEKEIREAEETLISMKHGKNKAIKQEIVVQDAKVKRLRNEQEKLIEREGKLNQESVARYQDFDSFLELVEKGYKWWKKADEEQKRRIVDLVVLNVVIDGNDVASVSLNEPFAGWAKRSKTEDGDGCTNRYYLFSITVELGKKLKYADYGAYQKRCETVYVREVDGLREAQKTTLELIKTSSG